MKGYSATHFESGEPMKRVLGLFHVLRGAGISADPITGLPCFDIFKCVEVHELRPKLGYTPCICIQLPCAHPFWHAVAITIKIGGRRTHAPS